MSSWAPVFFWCLLAPLVLPWPPPVLDPVLVVPASNWSHPNVALIAAMGTHWQEGLQGLQMLFHNMQNHKTRRWEAGENAAICLGCKAGASLVLAWVAAGASEDQLLLAVTNLCVVLNLYTAKTCFGVVSAYMPEIYYIVKQRMPSADVVCAVVLQMYGCVVLDPTHAQWEVGVDMGPDPEDVPDEEEGYQDGGGAMKVVQLTDLHWDPMYLQGSAKDCRDPICCRREHGPAPSPQLGAGPWGEYDKCDMPFRSVENALKHASTQHPDAAMVVMTGDLPHHGLWATSRAEAVHILSNMSATIRKYFPNTLVFPVLGNHEPHPANSYPYNSVPDPRFNPGWLYGAAAEAWQHWLPPDALDSVRMRGFYSTSPFPGLRILGLNTNMCYTLNWWLLYDWRDPEGHLRWLSLQLLESEKRGEAVLLLGHIAPGNEDCWGQWSKHFAAIVNRFRYTLRAQFYGHTHNDEFKIFFRGSRPSHAIFLAASLTTYRNLNPAYKVFHLSRTSWRVLEHETWTYNLSRANSEGVPVWYRLYGAKEAFGLTSLSPHQLDQLVHRMVHDQNLFQEYQRIFWRDSEAGLSSGCDYQCKVWQLCRLVTSDWSDQSKCRSIRMQVRPNYT